MAIEFCKYEGLGNDFILLPGAEIDVVGPERARLLCDRHFGVGGDGVIFADLRDGQPFMHVINADGSIPEMCGNGLRCAALYLHHRGLVEGTTVTVLTGAGPHRCDLSVDGDSAQVTVQMPSASLDAAHVLREAEGRFVDAPLEVGGRTVRTTAVSMGNPHLVSFDVDEALLPELGPAVCTHARTVAGANAGFARMGEAPGQLTLRVHERGAGWTLACGTGACAAAVAAIETGRASRGEPLEVALPGGVLRIVVGEPGEPIEMRGPARRVFAGTLTGWPAPGAAPGPAEGSQG